MDLDFWKSRWIFESQHQNCSIPVQKKWESMRVFQSWYQKSKLDTQFSKSLKNRESRSNLKYSIKILKIRMDFWKSLWIFSKSRSNFQSRRIIFWIVVQSFKIEIKTQKLYHNFGNWDGFLKIELKNRKSASRLQNYLQDFKHRVWFFSKWHHNFENWYGFLKICVCFAKSRPKFKTRHTIF